MFSVTAIIRRAVVSCKTNLKSIEYLSQNPLYSSRSRQYCVTLRNSIDRGAKASNNRTITTIMSQKPLTIFVLGGPGAGKGTQCQRIVDNYEFIHLSAGDLLREERAREGSEVGALIESYIRDGKIVPVDITCSLLENAMKKSGKNKFLIDGFPRNQDNLEGWNRKMADKVDFRFVIFLKCSEDVCVQRCMKRGETSGRSDDNLVSLRKRIETYNNDSMPIIKYYQQLGKVVTIDATQDADAVFNDVQAALKQCDN